MAASATGSLAFSPHFETLRPSDGLSQGNVNAVLQDPRGFMWFGTQDGLNRFDGYAIKVYGHDPKNPASIGDDFVNALIINSKDQLWIGTRSGVHRFDEANERFINYRIHDPNDPDVRDASVTALADAPDGAIWLGTQRGRIARMFADRDRLDWFDPPELAGAINTLFVDTDHILWIGSDAGLFRLNRQGDIERSTAVSPQQAISVVKRDSERRLWVGSRNDVGWIDGNDQYHPLSFDLGSRTTTILEDREHDLWIGTENNGLYRFHANLEWVGHFSYDSNLPTSLPSDEILSLFEDRTGVIWIGTRVGGVSRFDRNDEQFGHVYGTAAENGVYAIEELGDHQLLLGTRGGLVLLDTVSGSSQRSFHDPGFDETLSHDWVVSLARTRDGSIWVGTFAGGLNRFDPETGKVQRFKVDPDDPSAVGSPLVVRIQEDAEGRLWLATNDGLEVFDPAIGQVIQRYRNIPGDDASLSDDQIRALYFDPSNRLWIGTRSSGINILDLSTQTITRLTSDPDDPATLSSNNILCIVSDSQNRLWVGTPEGLNQLDPRTGAIKARFSEADGLPNEVVYGVVEADDGRLWLSTNQGLSRLDPKTVDFKNYDVHDGLQGNEYNLGAYGQTADGRLYFGGVNGVNLFRPPTAQVSTGPALPVITDVLLFNETIGHQGINPDSPLTRHPSLPSELELGYRDSVLTFEFSALHFNDPDHNRFAYRMRGLDDRWIYTDPRKRFATFTGLDPGQYQFQLKAASKDSDWNAVPISFDVRVTPPPWRSGWAYLVYLALLTTMAIIGIRIRRSQEAQRLRAQQAISESEERLRLSLWASGDVLWDWDLRAGIMRRFNLLDGINDDEVESASTIADYAPRMHPDDFDRVQQAFQSHLEGDSPYFEVTYRRRGDKQWIWILDRGQVVQRDRFGKAVRMAGTMKDVTTLKDTEAALRRLNDELESRVDDRTRELKKANDDLLSTLRKLRDTQGQLVESEKMASLGNLVAGVAHEINTPLGITVTAASHLNDATRRFRAAHQSGEISEAALAAYESAASQGSQLILDNLKRAARLVSSFKQVAVDQSDEKRRPFNLKDYIDEILLSLNPKLRRTGHTVRVDCPADIVMVSFPGALYQILSNLVINSLVHGFDGIENGTIDIQASIEDQDVRITYRDDGCGMTSEITQRIFEPFFTTRRNQGGSGLGLHIVYNLVTQGLQGSINCSSGPGAGVTFQMRFPIEPDLGRTGEMAALSGVLRPEGS